MLRLPALAAACVLLVAHDTRAYGVLAHEAIIDATWEQSIAPLLKSRFRPSEDQLKKARAFAYGGSLIQDLGYYPFSSRKFGDFTHYVRSGDFVVSLLNGASDVNEMAFALGALAHYSADNHGHPLGINRAVPLLYPKLRQKHGDVVTYADKPSAHLKTEFGFDVAQIARGAYLPSAYHDFIGFEVSRPVLERAFHETYGLSLDDVFGNFDFAVGTFRYAVGTMIPQMTRVAWAAKKGDLYSLTRAEFEKEFGTNYERPGLRSKILALVLRIVPKVGPFSGLAFKAPTPEAERLFLESFAVTLERYRQMIASTSRGRFSMANLNFDTGRPIKAGDYELADEAHARLLEKLQERGFKAVPPDVRTDLLSFFAEPGKSFVLAKDKKRLRVVMAHLTQLKALAAN